MFVCPFLLPRQLSAGLSRRALRAQLQRPRAPATRGRAYADGYLPVAVPDCAVPPPGGLSLQLADVLLIDPPASAPHPIRAVGVLVLPACAGRAGQHWRRENAFRFHPDPRRS